MGQKNKTWGIRTMRNSAVTDAYRQANELVRAALKRPTLALMSKLYAQEVEVLRGKPFRERPRRRFIAAVPIHRQCC
jgi:hypothetical protein